MTSAEKSHDFQPRSQSLSFLHLKASEGRKTVQAGHVSWCLVYLHERVPIYQNIVAARVCHIQNLLSW